MSSQSARHMCWPRYVTEARSQRAADLHGGTQDLPTTIKTPHESQGA